MSIESKEWWDVIAVGRYNEFDSIDQNLKRKEIPDKDCGGLNNGTVQKTKLSLKRPRSPHTNVYVELNGVAKRISVIDTSLSVELRKGGLVRWEGNVLQFTSHIEVTPINFVVSKVENVGMEAVTFIKRIPREKRSDTHR